MVYQWKGAARITIPAQRAGEQLEALRDQHGGVTAAIVVDDARKKRSPLHGAFEWDDSVAGTAHRLNQARYLLRAIVVVSEKAAPTRRPIRAFVHVSADGAGDMYESLEVALSTPEMRAQVLARALRKLEVWRARYEELEELAGVFAAIDGQQAA